MACHVAADEPPAIPTIQELRAHDKPPTIPTVQELSRARQTPRHLYRRRAPCGRRALRHQQAPDLCAAERTNHQFFLFHQERNKQNYADIRMGFRRSISHRRILKGRFRKPTLAYLNREIKIQINGVRDGSEECFSTDVCRKVFPNYDSASQSSFSLYAAFFYIF
ncbi:uncharacterized protein [Triticum aestivum]|uniref:uncharacterized protein n=1 Tax=Triticum aestivum TaxID=4565 RepID=UPI001D01C27D|nr:uncharacterized protein LOC123150621 [Triticum aestivum]